MFRDSDINIKKIGNFQEIFSLRFSVCFDQKSSIFYIFYIFWSAYNRFYLFFR